MKTITLGRTGIEVSQICLGTMTWGSQNSQAEANEQLDYAVSEGVNFIDTAEMYPTTPRKAETTGLTEEICGNWLKGRAINKQPRQSPMANLSNFIIVFAGDDRLKHLSVRD